MKPGPDGLVKIVKPDGNVTKVDPKTVKVTPEGKVEIVKEDGTVSSIEDCASEPSDQQKAKAQATSNEPEPKKIDLDEVLKAESFKPFTMPVPKRKPAIKQKPEAQVVTARPPKEEDPVESIELEEKDKAKKRIKEAIQTGVKLEDIEEE